MARQPTESVSSLLFDHLRVSDCFVFQSADALLLAQLIGGDCGVAALLTKQPKKPTEQQSSQFYYARLGGRHTREMGLA